MKKRSLLLLAFATVGISTQSYAMEEENFNTTKKAISIAPYEEPKEQQVINFIAKHNKKTIKASQQIDPTNGLAYYILHADGGEQHPAGDGICFSPKDVFGVIQMEHKKKSFILKLKAGSYYEFSAY